MSMFFFDVTVRVHFEGRPMEAVVYKAARADSELDARRLILNDYLNAGLQVLRLTRVAEKMTGER